MYLRKLKLKSMPSLTFFNPHKTNIVIPENLFKGKRHLTPAEISVLDDNLNTSEDPAWQNVLVDAGEFCFDPTLIKNSYFGGWVVLGRLCSAKLKYHDLELVTGVYRSHLKNVVTGDDNVIQNVSYLENYHLGSRVMLFNIEEMSCTLHSKFGNGILKQGEPESNRIWISVSNENGGRNILPFEKMLPSDAFLWSRYREDKELMQRFKEMTEYGNSGKLDTFGIVGDDAVIKNTKLIKDSKIGNCAYIKGALKIKNVTILSTEDEVSQIGEGVEIVNGIMGEGSHVFYQAVAIRFVIGKNCQLKYGARLINSVLGDNSTVSCCEILNNLIFPFHEQHHNSSFLIATTVMGQSNIAAGATIGSNHNSRSPDGEIIAGRGFWPGLCSDFKHNSRFASFTLVAKGSYQNELNITYPFALVAPAADEKEIHILPAWWFMYDMFAIVRNRYKFQNRDKRIVKVQNIETDPFAPDTIQEVVHSVERIIELTAANMNSLFVNKGENLKDVRQLAKDFLHKTENLDFTLKDMTCQKKYGAVICKPVQAYRTYRKIAKYFAVETLIEYFDKNSLQEPLKETLNKLSSLPLYTQWLNVGGQVMPLEKVENAFRMIKERSIETWEQLHDYYNSCQSEYLNDKVRYAIYILERLYTRKIAEFNNEIIKDLADDVIAVSDEMYKSSVSSREKDFTDFFRCMTYRNKEEMKSVLGSLDSIEFLKTLENDSKLFNKKVKELLCQN